MDGSTADVAEKEPYSVVLSVHADDSYRPTRRGHFGG